ncbi:HU family DNA-binding protein [Pseudonocardia alaniniphila]|uniref:HU family DNA-binding protein n=1 Tax=Pseudonocardia alaniniphila TaxID=75291 RepID=UPI002402D7A5|nr:HU family DNA-binding protein [Pseudonocardia alaniniphila]
MNKTQLVDVLAERLGDRRTAAGAVDGLLETIVDAVRSGDSVSLTGFGVFTSRARAARVARNPRTGETVNVPATTVPAFRPGTAFRTAVSGVEPQTSPRTAAAALAPAVVVTEQVDALEKPGKPEKAKQDDRMADKLDKADKIDKAAKGGKKAAKAKDGKPRKGKKK